VVVVFDELVVENVYDGEVQQRLSIMVKQHENIIINRHFNV